MSAQPGLVGGNGQGEVADNAPFADQDMPRYPCQPPPAEPPYQCTLCRKPFATELALQVHIKANRAAGTRCWRVADITRR